MTVHERWSRLRLLSAIATAALAVLAINAGSKAVQSARESRAFAPLLLEANGLSASRHRGETSAGTAGPLRALVVLVRDFQDSSTSHPAYHIQSGLHWRVAFATNATEATAVLLVDRIHLNARSYRPVGEDYQVVLHGTLMQWPTRTVISAFVVRGPRPANRAGWLSVFGLVQRSGAEPWLEAGNLVEAQLAAKSLVRN